MNFGPAKLTYSQGQFFFEGFPPAYAPKLEQSSYWVKVEDNVFMTTHLKAAARFRQFGNDQAEKVFKKAFNQIYPVPSSPPLPFLDPHQKEGVEWILTRSRSYLAHAPGAGKTAQAIVASLLSHGFGQILYIVPPSLSLNWEREFAIFSFYLLGFHSLTLEIVPKSNKQDQMNWEADVIICPDSLLAKDWVQAELTRRRWRFISVDEASRFKDPFSERSLSFYGGRKGEKVFPGIYQKSRHVVFMDGSPMPNRPMELWAPAYALDPESIDCMDQDSFGFRYCGPQITDRGTYEFLNSSNEDELRKKLQARFMHVVGEDRLSHPERRRSILLMNEDVRSHEQKNWEKKSLASLSLSGIDEETSQGEIASFRLELGRRKVQFIGQYVAEKLKEKNEFILLFVWHREVAEMLGTNLQNYNPGVVIGGVKDEVREKIFAEFQEGKRKLIIGNISAMGRGHNLQRADRIIFGEFSWTDELNKQCEKRASRRGRAESNFVRCEYIVCPDSMDEKVLRSVFAKERRVKRVIG